MANYLSLEEAAAKLGISTDRLVDLRSQGQVRGFRDGASWKFPEDAIEQLGEDLAAGASDLGIGGESLLPGSGSSDVNLVTSEGTGSDVEVVASDKESDFMLESEGDDLLEIDSSELQLNDNAISHDSAQLDLAVEPNAGSTGPVTDEELREISESHPDVLPPEGEKSGGGSSLLDIGGDEDSDDLSLESESDLSFSSGPEDEDSGDELIGADGDSSLEVLGSGLEQAGEGSKGSKSGASSLEMMDELDLGGGSDASGSGANADVLSELDLLGAEQQGSGLISGDSENNLLASSGLGSSLGADSLRDSDLGGLDDALADDDDLVISDDDDDLVLGSAGSDISVAGDSGINLMSPSDSGLSLESEPLDLAGSSISALDLGAELSDGGSSGSGGGAGSGGGSGVEFEADEEFQLSPSGVGLDADIESGSQVIEVEDSEALGEPVEFAEPDALGGDVFAEDAEGGEVLALDEEGEAVAIDDSGSSVMPAAASAYEVPFTMLQCVTLMLILAVMAIGGMLVTDLVRNMWAYSEPSAPVSSLTDSLIGLMGWD